MASEQHHHKSSLAALTLAAVGIVYGDIGTSPLYAMKEVFSPEHGLVLTQANLLGVVSLIFWSLTAVVSIKYVTLILRADNHGEGGIMALLALTLSSVGKTSRSYFPLLVIGLFGAALFFGDGIITPAISVLSAIEGLEVATPAFKPYVVPLTLILLTLLYAVQKHGTAGIGQWFGPIMLIWFATLAAMGVINIIAAPQILAALNPLHALEFMIQNRWIAFIALGAVVLTLTGAEALYADMGHFGRKPVRMAWFFITFPALALNYLGQGSLLMNHPDAISNPFFQQLGAWSVYPLIGLSTVATIIASQATISGTYSMTKQAISLGFLPRMKIIFLTMHPEVGYAVKALSLGSCGYVLKSSAADELIDAIRAVVRGDTYVTPRIAGSVIEHFRKAKSDPSHVEMSDREREVLQLIAEGRTFKDIATILDISPRTVEFHRNRIAEKTGFRTTAELARYAVRIGIVGG